MRQWMHSHRKDLKTIFLFLIIIVLLKSVYEDALVMDTTPVDMRDRVVGSRLMMDSKPTYYYIWNSRDTLAYYDPTPPFTLLVSRATATPFFHHFFGLIARLPQYQLNNLWFFLQYFLLAFCLLMVGLCTLPDERWKWRVMATVAVLFTYTFGWRLNMNAGQNYLVIAAMAAGCYFSLSNNKGWLYPILFAAFACSLVLLRPTAVLLFTPLLLYLKDYKKWILPAAVLFLLYVGFVLISPLQRSNWVGYFQSLKVNVQYHQGKLAPVTKLPYVVNSVRLLEGTDLFGGIFYGEPVEYHNFYILVAEVFVKKVTIMQMTIIGIVSCLLLLYPLKLVKKYKLSAAPDRLLLLGFIVYNTYEFFTPIPRYDYQLVQFIFPLLLAVAYAKRLYLIPAILLATGLWLSTATWDFMKTERRLGEGILTLGLVLLIYRDLIMRYIKEERFITRNHLYLL